MWLLCRSPRLTILRAETRLCKWQYNLFTFLQRIKFWNTYIFHLHINWNAEKQSYTYSTEDLSRVNRVLGFFFYLLELLTYWNWKWVFKSLRIETVCLSSFKTTKSRIILKTISFESSTLSCKRYESVYFIPCDLFYFVELVKSKVHGSTDWNVVNFRAALSRPSHARFQVVAERSCDQYFMQWIIHFSEQFPCIRELTSTHYSYFGHFKFISANTFINVVLMSLHFMVNKKLKAT